MDDPPDRGYSRASELRDLAALLPFTEPGAREPARTIAWLMASTLRRSGCTARIERSGFGAGE
jgi:hypothetical protein